MGRLFLLRRLPLGVGQHELDAVFLVDLGGAGVVIHGDNVGVRVVVFQDPDHALAHNVVGQAAEGLGTDDVGGAGVDELQHLGGEEPPLAHFAPVVEVAVNQLMELSKGAGGPEAGVFQGADHVQLAFLHISHEEFAQGLLGPAAAKHLHVGDPVVNLEDQKVCQTGDHRFSPFVQEKLLQLVVAQGGELDVDFPHHAHPDLLLAGHGNGLEIRADLLKDAPHFFPGHTLSPVEAVEQLAGPEFHLGGGVPGADLIGPHLVGHVHDEVPVHHAVDQPADEPHGPVKAGVLLQAKGEGEDGDIVQPRLFQGLAEHVDVVGGPAAPAGLGDEQGHFMGVIASVLNGVDHLADDQQCGIAGVVVYVF